MLKLAVECISIHSIANTRPVWTCSNLITVRFLEMKHILGAQLLISLPTFLIAWPVVFSSSQHLKIVHSYPIEMSDLEALVGPLAPAQFIPCSQYNIKFERLYIVNGLANFSASNATFIQNSGNRGGALALIGWSSLLVGTKGNYLFAENTAMDRGSAIILTPGRQALLHCI